ncbi:MAG: helix-turn-helix transcriptional regulator [Steroidobacteraceae bacterium]
MARFEVVNDVYGLLRSTREPISLDQICEASEISRATAKRVLRFLREEVGLPITYDRNERGFTLGRKGNLPDSVLGPWFSADELLALLTAHTLLEQLSPGVLREDTLRLQQRLQRLLYKRSEGTVGRELAERVRLSLPNRRSVDGPTFHMTLTGLLRRKRLKFSYLGRARNESTERMVSPLRLTFYRSNWYLAAWCHGTDDLRIFSLDRVTDVSVLARNAHDPDEDLLRDRLESSYGIFEGKATRTAKLRFAPGAARWIADEIWHPEQKQTTNGDGSLLLEVPYRETIEIVMDVMRHGVSVEVLGPRELREAVARAHALAAAQYGS